MFLPKKGEGGFGMVIIVSLLLLFIGILLFTPLFSGILDLFKSGGQSSICKISLFDGKGTAKCPVKEVKILQAHMNRLGFASGKEDGILGSVTDAAIKRMQVYLGTKPDGHVGPITRKLINNSCGTKT